MMQRTSFPRMAGVGSGVVASLALFASSGRAQDALRSAVVGDRAYQSRTAPVPVPRDYHTAGPLSYSLGVGYSLEWIDNVFYADRDTKSDFIHTPSLDMDTRWQISKESQLHFGAGISYRKYQQTKGQDRLGVTPNSELAWDIKAKDWLFTLYDRFNYSQDVLSQPGLTNSASFPRFENTAGFRASWRPSRVGLQLGYGHENSFSSAAAFSYLGRVSEHFFSRLGYSFAPRTEVGVEVSGGLTDYTQTVQPDNQNFSAGPFANWQITQAFGLDVRGGYVTYFFDSNPGSQPLPTMSSYYAGFGAHYQITRHLQNTFDITKEVQQALNVGGQFVKQTSIRNNISWAFHKHASLGGGVFYTIGEEPNRPPRPANRFNQLGFGTTLRYDLTSNLAPSVRYTYARRNSNQGGGDYVVNSVSVSLNYRF